MKQKNLLHENGCKIWPTKKSLADLIPVDELVNLNDTHLVAGGVR